MTNRFNKLCDRYLIYILPNEYNKQLAFTNQVQSISPDRIKVGVGNVLTIN